MIFLTSQKQARSKTARICSFRMCDVWYHRYHRGRQGERNFCRGSRILLFIAVDQWQKATCIIHPMFTIYIFIVATKLFCLYIIPGVNSILWWMVVAAPSTSCRQVSVCDAAGVLSFHAAVVCYLHLKLAFPAISIRHNQCLCSSN